MAMLIEAGVIVGSGADNDGGDVVGDGDGDDSGGGGGGGDDGCGGGTDDDNAAPTPPSSSPPSTNLPTPPSEIKRPSIRVWIAVRGVDWGWASLRTGGTSNEGWVEPTPFFRIWFNFFFLVATLDKSSC